MSENNFSEKIQTSADQLVDTVKRLVSEGNVRKITLRKEDGKEFLAIPLTAGVVVGGIAVLAAPTIAAIAAIAGLFSSITIEVERRSPEEAAQSVDPDDPDIIDVDAQ